MQPAIGDLIKSESDKAQRELQPEEILKFFESQWISNRKRFDIVDIASTHLESQQGEDAVERVSCFGSVKYNGEQITISGKGNGPLDAFVEALGETSVPKFNISDFHEHSIGQGSNTCAVAYVQITTENGEKFWGVGKSSNVGRAGINAVVSALNQ